MNIPPQDVLVVRVKPTSFSFYISVIDEKLKDGLSKKKFRGSNNVGSIGAAELNYTNFSAPSDKNEILESGEVTVGNNKDGTIVIPSSSQKNSNEGKVGAVRALKLSTGPINLVDARFAGEFFDEYLRVGEGDGKRHYSKVYCLQATQTGSVELNGKPLGIVIDQNTDDPVRDSGFLSIVSRVYLLSKIRLARERMRVALDNHYSKENGRTDDEW